MDKSALTRKNPLQEEPRSGSLRDAHRGYAYQDLATAYLLVRCLIQRYEAVVVDRKIVADDRFDDIEVIEAGLRTRRQLKFSIHADTALSYADFNGARSSLRFDRLVNTFTAEGKNAANEYRLCATWQEPCPTDPIVSLLVPCQIVGTFEGYPTQTFNFDPNRVWPEGGNLVFASLQERLESESVKTLIREEVLSFCKRFIIEVALPPASLDLDMPGSLENLLLVLLTDQIGIGRYPNGERRVEDVAALAIHIASTARANGAKLKPSDLANRLKLRTDFGRITQAFPLDKSVLQERLPLRKRLYEAITENNVSIHLVLAGPGAGKSWTLTQLADDLSRQDLVVARHYCFLEPGDELVERRVTTDVFFGNLLGELSDAFKARSCTPPQRFAAEINALELFLSNISEAGYTTVIIVDGLDHITRVRDASADLRDNETDIIERLATLNLPQSTTLVIGSQPGAHLDPLRNAFNERIREHIVEPWSREEIIELAYKYGVNMSLDRLYLLEEEHRASILDLLVQRSEGNPLYARYLSRGLTEGLSTGAIANPLDWLRANPIIDGDIACYYKHLYDSISKQAQAIADILGVLDFSVMEADLGEITGGVLRDWIPEALQVMSPVLTQAVAQGGLRIFHESFRRFMLQELQRRGRSLANILMPVIRWLEFRGFFTDTKSYRFMLPLMRRAGYEAEILQRVSNSFVRESLEHGHSYEAIDRNLTLTADVAARSLNWPALVRCAELFRAFANCFDEGTNDWQEYWLTYEAIYGPQALADRLLFDGQPTLTRTEGLLACELIDCAGISAPWQEYLMLPVPEEGDTDSSDFDPWGAMQAAEKVGLAIIRGRLRLGQHLRIIRRIHTRLFYPEAKITSVFLREVAKLLAQEISPHFVEQIVRRINFRPPQRYILRRSFACALLLGLSDAASDTGDNTSAAQYAVSALYYASTPEEAVWCTERGAPPEQALAHAKPLSSIDIAVEGDRHTVSALAVRQWLASVRLAAFSESFRISLTEQHQRINGIGWYRCWLRFVLASAQAEAAAAENRSYDIKKVFAELVGDTRPFEGIPRACDLYRIHRIIEESFARGLALIRTPEEWQEAISIISQARSGTSTRLDREDGGPITAGAFFSIFLPYASTSIVSKLIAQALEQELIDEEANGTYYSTHAEFRMYLARFHARALQKERALNHWREASKFFLGYGFHKDTTIFDIIESAPILLKYSESAALIAFIRLQPLLSAVLSHTDHRETRHAPKIWFRSLLKVNVLRAIELLCRDLTRNLGASWIAEQAQKDVLCHLRDSADPMLLDTLWKTLLLEIEYEDEGERVAKERLDPLERLLSCHPEYVRERFTQLCAEVFNDARHYRGGAVARLRAFAEQHGLVMPWTVEIEDKQEEKDRYRRSASLEKTPDLKTGQRPAFPQSLGFVEILTVLRKLSLERLPREQVDGVVTLPLSYAITEMVDRGEEAQAQRLLYFLVHETSAWFFEPVHPIASLAECLDNAGHAKLAAVAYTLAFSSSRGGGGWLNFGDRTQASTLHRAMVLDKDQALKILAQEAARKLRGGSYAGIARHLIEQIADWGDQEEAVRAWEEAFTVLENRLSLSGRMIVFEPLDMKDVIEWSVDEALATLLLTRIGNASIPRKVAALSGFARLLQERPSLFNKPLEWVLTRDITVSTAQIILQILLETPEDLTQLLQPLTEILKCYAHSDAWSLSLLAEKLLNRASCQLSVMRSRPVVYNSSPSPRGVVITRCANVDQMLGTLQQLWPELPMLVASRMEQPAIDNEVFKYRARQRAELAFGRNGNLDPPAPVLSWPTEMVVAILDKILMGLHEQLWRRGKWDTDVEDYVLCNVLPDLQLHLALDGSRVPRPNWPLAEESQDQVTDIVRVPSGDPMYGGWIRLAFHEQRFYHSDKKDYLSPDGSVIQSSAIVRAEIDGTVPEQASALPPGDVSLWWNEIRALKMLAESRKPQFLKLAIVDDCLGRGLALVPPPVLQYHAQLRFPGYGEPLRWYDSAGQETVVLRTWRVRSDHSDVEWHSTTGADLLMHPELLNLLLQVYGAPLKELTRLQNLRRDSA